MKSVQDIAKERAEVMLHFANGGEIEALYYFRPHYDWRECSTPGWDWYSYNYRIKQPTKQRIKMLCYYNTMYSSLDWYADGAITVGTTYIRQPHLDMEVEV